eukprot:gene41378-30395_t
MMLVERLRAQRRSPSQPRCDAAPTPGDDGGAHCGQQGGQGGLIPDHLTPNDGGDGAVVAAAVRGLQRHSRSHDELAGGACPIPPALPAARVDAVLRAVAAGATPVTVAGGGTP